MFTPNTSPHRSSAFPILFTALAPLLIVFFLATASISTSTSAAPLAPTRPASTSSSSPDLCNTYLIASSPGTISPGTTDAGNHCDNCVTPLQPPFPITLYDVTTTTLNVSSNGLLSIPRHIESANTCLPSQTTDYSIMPYWDDLRTDCQGCGVFVSTTGVAPNRKYNIEWRTIYASTQGTANFEVQFNEGSSTFAIILGTTTEAGAGATIGVQQAANGCFTEYKCNSAGLGQGLVLTFYPSGQPTPTTPPNATSTPVPTITPGGPSPTPTTCTIYFTDVHTTDYFYTPVQYLYCHGIISGYADNTFRPYNNTTRSQLIKADVLGFAFPIATPTTYSFEDVPPSHPFYQFVETAYAHHIISGYVCGSPFEPCVPPLNRPYFRPYNNITRGQLSKVVTLSAGWPLLDPPTGTFQDVLPGSTFYEYVETTACRNVVSGYNCGGPGEPCDPPNRPYFRPNNNATRGQVAKIIYLSITGPPSCSP